MLKNIALIVGVFIAAILIFAATRPDTFSVERSIDIKASPEKVFALINDLHSWTTWSPYEKKDPDMKRQQAAQEVAKEQSTIEMATNRWAKEGWKSRNQRHRLASSSTGFPVAIRGPQHR